MTYPNVLLVVLKRFSFRKKDNTSVKICKKVKAPIVLQCNGGDLSKTLGAGLNLEGKLASSGHCPIKQEKVIYELL